MSSANSLVLRKWLSYITLSIWGFLVRCTQEPRKGSRTTLRCSDPNLVFTLWDFTLPSPQHLHSSESLVWHYILQHRPWNQQVLFSPATHFQLYIASHCPFPSYTFPMSPAAGILPEAICPLGCSVFGTGVHIWLYKLWCSGGSGSPEVTLSCLFCRVPHHLDPSGWNTVWGICNGGSRESTSEVISALISFCKGNRYLETFIRNCIQKGRRPRAPEGKREVKMCFRGGK